MTQKIRTVDSKRNAMTTLAFSQHELPRGQSDGEALRALACPTFWQPPREDRSPSIRDPAKHLVCMVFAFVFLNAFPPGHGKPKSTDRDPLPERWMFEYDVDHSDARGVCNECALQRVLQARGSEISIGYVGRSESSIREACRAPSNTPFILRRRPTIRQK